MTRKIGVVMDPIESIKPWKDSSFAMMLEAQSQEWQVHYMLIDDLYMDNGIAYAQHRKVALTDRNTDWFESGELIQDRLDSFDVIIMRKDPPFDLEYIYATYLLEQAAESGTLVVNKPSSLRDCNEKMFTRNFPQCCVPTRISRKADLLKAFVEEYQDVIIKPLDGMGGQSIFRVKAGDNNTNVIIETVTNLGRSQTMAQKYIPEIVNGDKRILLIDGVPVPYALARLPAAGENRGNIAAGATTRGQPLSERDQWICDQIGPALRERGLLFVGIDVIGDYLTEINVTSPTCIRELDAEFGINISGDLFNAIEKHLTH